MKKNYTTTVSWLMFALFLFVGNLKAQTTVTINATGTAGSYMTGSVNSAGTKNDDPMITINSGANRGWAHFDLSSIPSGASIVSANAIFTTYTSTSSTAVNNIYGFLGDPSVIAGATLYTNCGSGTSFNAAAWTANATNTQALNATGTAFLAANFGSSVNLGYVRGSTNTYNIYGYGAAAANQPQLQITYFVPTACSGTPAPGAVTATPSSVNIAQSFTLSLPGTVGVTGLTYQWQSSPDGVTFTDISGATSATYTGTETASTYYQCVVTCTASGFFATATPVQVVLNPVLNMTNGSASVCSVNFYDSGGSAANYLDNENYTLTLYPATAGAALQVLFNSFTIETCCDNLTIYDGNSTAAPLIGTYTTNPGTILSTAVDGSLTFVFNSDVSLNYAGWDATVSCISPCAGTPTAGAAASDNNPVCVGSNFVLSLTGATVAAGITYQWQSSTDGVTFSDITGATAATYTTNQSAATYYQCVVTCTASGMSSTSTPVNVTMNGFMNCYCTSIPTNTADEEIFSVTVNGATNAYNCTTVAPGPGSLLNQYSNFRTLPPLTAVMQGQTVSFTVLEDECDGATYYSNGASIWIDFNQNGLFTDPGEQVYVEATTTISPRTITGTFTVPIGATVGTTGMRIIVAEGISGAGLTPCMSYGYGETEDYLIDITATTACAGTPTAGTTTSTATAICPSTPFNLGLSGSTISSGLTYQWQSSSDGVTYTDITGATNNTYTASQTSDTYYQCVVTCTNSGLSDISTPVQVTTNSFLACYCSSGATSTADEDILNVTIGTLNNTSSCTTTGGPGSVMNQYSDYTAVTAPVLAQTVSYPFSVQVGTCGGTYTNSTRIFIDFNQNGLFTDPGETVYTSAAGTAGAHTESGSILIPGTALAGTTRMRVITVETGTPTSITPCGTYGWGETEDYFVTIAPLPAVPPTPAQDPSVPTCATGTQLTVPGSAPVGEVWYWQLSATDTSTLNPVAGPYTVNVNGTYYVNSYNPTYNIWSGGASSVTVTNIPYAATPPAPTAAASPACLSTNLMMSSPATGIGYFWQGTNATGTSSAQNASAPYAATATGTYYVAAYDSTTTCWSATDSVSVVIDTYVPAAPTSVMGDTVCQGSLSAMISGTGGGSGTVTYSFGTAINSPGPATPFTITVPALPAGATVTSTTLVIHDATSIGGSWQSEIRVALSGATTLAATQISTVTGGGTVTPNPYNITVPNVPVGGGNVTLTLSESFDDAGTDATFSNIELVIVYTLPSSTISWWDAASSGTMLGTASPFETVGTSPLPTTNIAGTYQFYIEANSGACSSASRTAVPVLVNPLPSRNLNDTSVCTASTYLLDAQNAGSTYTWNTTETTQTISIATNGLYFVDITNPFGCSARDSINITLNALPFVDLGADASFCAGDSISFDAGNTGFNFLWNTGSTAEMITATASGNYYVGVTNPSTGCVNYDTAMVTIIPLPVIHLGSDSLICVGDSLVLDAGNPGSTYSWSTSSTNQTITINAAGTYSVLVVNPVTTCYNMDTVTIGLNALPTVAIGPDSSICVGSTLTLDAGNPGSAYVWNDASTLQTLDVTAAGTYFVSIIDPNGCKGRDTIAIGMNPLPVVNIGPDSAQCGGAIVLDAANTGATYLWNDASTNQTLAANATGTYYVDVTDANGCVARDSAMITIHVQPTPTLGNDTVFCGTNILLDAGYAGMNYQWSNAATTQTINVFISGNYGVVVTDTVTGCTDSGSVNITIKSVPVVDLGADTTQCGGVITLDAGSGATGYLWSTGATSSTVTVSSSANYYVTVTNGVGCSVTDTVAVTIHTLPAVGLIPFTSPVCLQALPFTITNGTPSGGTYSGTGVSSNMFDPSVAGIGVVPITYTVTDAFACSNSATQNITVQDCSGVEEYGFSQQVSIYPNPSSGTFTVAIPAAKYAKLLMNIVNVEGQIVYSFEQKDLNGDFLKDVQLNDLAKGIYYIRLTADDHVKIEKLVIQ